ncbi:hypothetical protein [Acinetobacter sp.]|uniref:hypothetical protein n=1 Tax=Acinetobacter sp. TaxID=472 RepID=UPI00388DC1EE
MRTIENIQGPRDLTKNQLIQLINQQCGGWPAVATRVYQFESQDPKETVYRFTNERAQTLEDKPRILETPLWELRLTRDEYLIYHLSREAKDQLARDSKLIQRLKAMLP